MISIDMPAGPSEVLVIADRNSNPVHVASDLLSQVLNYSFLLLLLLFFFFGFVCFVVVVVIIFEFPRCLLALKCFCSFLMEHFHNERLML
jgi:hypothetical protein